MKGLTVLVHGHCCDHHGTIHARHFQIWCLEPAYLSVSCINHEERQSAYINVPNISWKALK